MNRVRLGTALLAGLMAVGLSWGQKPAENKPAGKSVTNAKKAPPKHKTAFTDEKSAGPDFQVQGEYVGEINGKKYGAQIIAQGDGSFIGYILAGGLPGQGWDGKTKSGVDGNTKGDITALEGTDYKADIAGRKLMLTHRSNPDIKGSLERVVRTSPTLGAEPPKGAIVLFDGTSADAFSNGKVTDDGLLQEGTRSKDKFGGGTLHIEFRTPFMPYANGQQRGNSGVYLQGRHEVQVLDSFGLKGESNEAGGIYKISAPSVNMCFPPLSWQTYDIDYTPAVYNNEGKKTASARITVKHNGVVIQDNVELPNPTRSSITKAGPANGPLHLQNHGNPVRYRNIWFVPANAK